MPSKKAIHTHFLATINESIARIQTALNELKDSGANETKSTAGDKHETELVKRAAIKLKFFDVNCIGHSKN